MPAFKRPTQAVRRAAPALRGTQTVRAVRPANRTPMKFKKPTMGSIGRAAAMTLGPGRGIAKKALSVGPKAAKPMKMPQKQAPAKKTGLMMKKMPKKR